MLAYKVWTEDEIKNRNIVDAGNYPFVITKILQTKTKGGLDKNGNIKLIYDMLEIDFEFEDIHGVVRNCKDWIVFMERMDWKFRHLADATKNIDLYEEQKLEPSDLMNKKGVFTLGIKDYEKDGEVKKVNYVKDYVKSSDQQDKSFADDDIPM